MKFRKLKLAALLATAVLTAGTMSLTSLAADDEVEITIDNDGGENEALPEYGVMTIAGAGVDENKGKAEGYTLDPKSFWFYYKETGHEDGEYTYIKYSPEDGDGYTVAEYEACKTMDEKYALAEEYPTKVVVFKDVSTEISKPTVPECKYLQDALDTFHPGQVQDYSKVYQTVTVTAHVDGGTYTSAPIAFGDIVKHKDTYTALGTGTPPSCLKSGEGSFLAECSVCKRTKKVTSSEIDDTGIIPPLGHAFDENTVVYVDTIVGVGATWGSKQTDVSPDGLTVKDGTPVYDALVDNNYKLWLSLKGTQGVPSKYSLNYVSYNIKLVTDKTGKVTGVALDNETKDGCYWTANVCTRNGCLALENLQYHFIWAKKAESAEIIKTENVLYGLDDDHISAANANNGAKVPLDGTAVFSDEEAAEIPLTDCDKDARYWVRYLNGDDDVIDTREFTIAKHHIWAKDGTTGSTITIEFLTKADAQKCKVVWVPANTSQNIKAHWEVINISCDANKPAQYVEVQHCEKKGVDGQTIKCSLTTCSKATRWIADSNGGATPVANEGYPHTERASVSEIKTANATGRHAYSKNTRDALHQLFDEDATGDETLASLGPISWEQVVEFKKYVADNKLKVTYEITGDCESKENGKLVITYPCEACGYTPVWTESIEILPGHAFLDPSWNKDIVEPTCTTTGLHDVMKHCDRCGKDFAVERNVQTPRLPHTNEIKDLKGNHEADYKNTKKKEVLLQTLGTIVVDDEGYLRNHQDDYVTYLTNFTERSADNALLTVDGYLYTVCENCEKFRVVLTDPYAEENATALANKVLAEKDATLKTIAYDNTKLVTPVSITVKPNSLVPQDTNLPCKPGSVTLVFTYTDQAGKEQKVEQTFPYYSSKATYAARGDHRYGAEYLDTAASVAPTETTEGKNVYKRKCEVCGEETVVRTVTVPALGTPAEKLGAVTGLKAEAIGLGRVQLSWNPVEGADYYTILLHDSFEYQGSIAAVTAPKCTITVSGLDTEVFSHIWVAPVKKGSNGKDTVGDAGEYVSILAREVPSVTGVKTTIEDGKILVTWKAQTRANTYSVVVKSTTDSASTKYVVGDETEFTLNNTVKGKGYYFWVYAGFENSRTNKDGKSIGQSVSSTGTFASAVAK